MAKPKPPEQLSPYSQEAADFATSLLSESPIACVLISVSFTEKALAALLHAYFIKSTVSDAMLSFEGGILGTLKSRTDAAYALGLIDKPIYENLLRLGTMRNRIAHSHTIKSFADGDIVALCDELTMPKLNGEATGFKLGEADKAPWPAAQQRFIAVVSIMAIKIHEFTEKAERRESPALAWNLSTSESSRKP